MCFFQEVEAVNHPEIAQPGLQLFQGVVPDGNVSQVKPRNGLPVQRLAALARPRKKYASAEIPPSLQKYRLQQKFGQDDALQGERLVEMNEQEVEDVAALPGQRMQ